MVALINSYKSRGIIEHGKVGHRQLANIMCNTSIWAYPCTSLGETFCITAIKCQASGCIPVINRIAALNETVHPDAPSIPILISIQQIEDYRKLLLDTLKRVEEDTTAERQKYIEFAKKFTWSNSVNAWLSLYYQVTK